MCFRVPPALTLGTQNEISLAGPRRKLGTRHAENLSLKPSSHIVTGPCQSYRPPTKVFSRPLFVS